MPHQCTGCSRVFDDGSKEMLSGCPDCGGHKFQYLPSGAVDQATGATASADSASPPQTERDQGSQVIDGEVSIDAEEDRAQATARSAVVSDHELPADPAAGAETVQDEASEAIPTDDPGLAELRNELNKQFESIKILQPGEYELNLMELYDREEYIIALKEDGRYVIEVPGSWSE